MPNKPSYLFHEVLQIHHNCHNSLLSGSPVVPKQVDAHPKNRLEEEKGYFLSGCRFVLIPADIPEACQNQLGARLL